MDQTQHASLSPRYWIKQAIITLVVLGLGVWGFLDGFIIYPAQAVKYAQWSEWEYLRFLEAPPPGSAIGASLSNASIPDPREAYETLGRPSNNRSPATLNDYKGNWLDALSIAGRLDPAYTTFPRNNEPEGEVGSAFERLGQLRETWGQVDRGKAPKRRSRLDILAQYPIFMIGFGLAIYFAYGLVRAASTRYEWDPASKRITLPGGVRVTPDQVQEFDKSRWHKFYVELHLTSDHPTHPGRSIRVDLYRHNGVEDWILEMERERFPEREAVDASHHDTAGPKEPDPQAEQPGGNA